MKVFQPQPSAATPKKNNKPPPLQSKAVNSKLRRPCKPSTDEDPDHWAYHRMPLLLTTDELAFYLGLSHSTVCELTNKKSPRFLASLPPRIFVEGTASVRFSARATRKWVDDQERNAMGATDE